MRAFQSISRIAVVVITTTMFLLTSIPSYAEEYICPMHPHIVGKEGDSCPICGMTLVPKPKDEIPSDSDEHSQHPHQQSEQNGQQQANTMNIAPQLIQSLGVQVGEISHHEFGARIRAFGKVVPNMRLEYSIDAHSAGRISDLLVNAEGDSVKKGQLLYTYYSPDLINAQSDFLIGSRANNAEQRLRLFGMDDRSIELLKKKKTFIEEVPFHSPTDGIVTRLNVRHGSHLNAGENVMNIHNFNKVWVVADVPLKDLHFLKLGDTSLITIPETGEHFISTISFIYPINNPSTRTAQVRVELDNPDGALRPDTYVDVEFESTPAMRLAVPSDAVLYSSAGSYVFEEIAPGKYQAKKVQTGITSNGLTEITSGLSHGQRIVTSGQFMIDVESKIRGIDWMSEPGTESEPSTPKKLPQVHQH